MTGQIMDGGLLCLLFVGAVIVLFIHLSRERRDRQYRRHCGECRYISGWLTESGADEDAEAHYRAKHHGVEVGGVVEVR
ncbi:hypothetical protein ACFWUP_19680 [Nocardia sp. NPDC058658]|uniref:hypothetical protein n=1 Tax=Nocardia sp. NPDC058658 TaxID=3346580 RepID=UPI003657AA74